ncbi:hypothetical protein KSX_84870 [Ktedonospora formicarum]|uniref:Uncharacterized protein n=1 Tax=Ktedonospora formicarum TaxID=2778364 RepID=A0A8J3I681_9CHLR|nr:hypothetical protein KSX_84870 [Ktedonospora formicarum]
MSGYITNKSQGILLCLGYVVAEEARYDVADDALLMLYEQW